MKSEIPKNLTDGLPVEAIILAAGKGTRMGSDLPKVLHHVADRAMVHWVLNACEQVGSSRNVIVVGHQAEKVREELASRENCRFVEQKEQLGTGHAVLQAAELYAESDCDLLVLCGDGPLIRAQTLRKLLETHRRTKASATLATAQLDDPTGYGRVVRDSQGKFQRIVEHKDASEAERKIREVNPSYYCFSSRDLFTALKQVKNNNSKGEYYLPDVLAILLKAGRTVSVIEAVPTEDVLSINTPAELATVDAILRQRNMAGAQV